MMRQSFKQAGGGGAGGLFLEPLDIQKSVSVNGNSFENEKVSK